MKVILMVKGCKNATVKPINWLTVSYRTLYSEKLYWTLHGFGSEIEYIIYSETLCVSDIVHLLYVTIFLLSLWKSCL